MANPPWMDYQPPTAATEPGAAAQLPADGPWTDYEEGFSGSVTATSPEVTPTPGRAPAKNADELRTALTEMVGRRAPYEEIQQFVKDSGFDFTPDTQSFFETQYNDPESYVHDVAGWHIQDPPRQVGAGEAAWAGLKSAALRGFDDEWDAFWGATGNKLGTALGMNESDAGFWDIYDQLAQRNREDKDAAWDQQTAAYSLGFLPGMLMGPSWVRGGGSQPLGWAQRARQAATVGGIEGGLSAAGNADTGPDENFLNRAPDALFGITTGAALGPVADRALGAVVGSGRRLVRGVLPPRGVNSGVEVLASRAETDPVAMRAAAERMRQAGIDPRLVDITSDEGRSVIREVAARPTPARDEVAQHADEVYAGAPERIADQANRISDDPRSARSMSSQTEDARDFRMEDRMRPIRDVPVELTDDIVSVLGTREGRAALRAAEGFMTDPADRESVRAVMSALRTIEQLDPRLPPAVRQKVTREIMGDSGLTVDMIDKFARAMEGRARTTPGLERVANQFSRIVRGAARDVEPRYDQALREYSDASRVAEAARGEGRFEDTSFLKTAPDQFAETARLARSEPTAMPVTTPRDTTSRLERTGDIDPFLAEATDDGLDGGIFRYTSRSGDEIPFQVYFGEDGVAHIDLSMGEVPNALGPSEIRFLMADLQEMYPQIKSFEGFRISGARKAAKTRVTQGQRSHFDQNPEAYDRMGGIVSDLNTLAEHLRGEFVDVDIADITRELRGMDPKVLGEALHSLSGARRDVVAHDLVERGIEFEMPRQIDMDQTVPALNASQMERTAPTRMTLSEEQAQRARWRDEVRDAAREGRGQNAMTVARQVASGPAQRDRNAVALGGRGAMELEEGMAGEVRRVENTRAIDPRAGNQPRTRGGRDAIVDGFTDAAAAIVSAGAGGSRWPIVHTAAKWLRHGGIRNVDAERLARDAISDDPARVEAAITYLEQRGMNRARAQRFISSFASALAGRTANSDSSNTPPPNSVRAILREGNRQ